MMQPTRRDCLKAASLTLLGFNCVAQAKASHGNHLRQLQRDLDPRDGVLFSPGTADYLARRQGFNLRTANASPAAILLCYSDAAVRQAVVWSKQQGVPLHLRAGGHSYEGYNSGDGLLLDLSGMDGFEIDPDRRLVRIQGGVKQGPLRQALARQGLVLPGGTCATVGMAGLTLGGGYGPMTRRLGLTCDRLQALKVIDHRGTVISADAVADSDLLWAGRGGGGGQFGVVSELTLRAHAASEVWTFSFDWPGDRLEEVVSAWQAWAPFVDNRLTCRLTIDATAREGVTYLRASGMFTADESATLPSEADFRRLLKPLTRLSPSKTKVQRESIAESEEFGDLPSPPMYFKSRSDFVSEPLGRDAMATLRHALETLQTGWIVLILTPGGGVMADVEPTATAHVHRRALFGIQYYNNWENESETAAHMKSSRDVYSRMRPFVNGGAYVNYVDAELEDWERAYFGENIARLRRIKNAYDPDNFFHTGLQSIRPPG